ncbi:UDP-N-acetylenolpyruvoylglucosamine reductase [Candidatus Gracilibacteria bacterium]|nr:MAG: UDP-N-acetylenolpyruvoylglucosamine reductase [Candidatus Gracilibacteria bacterium]
MQILQKNIDITNLSNFKTKTKAKYFYELKCEDYVKILPEIFDFAKKNNLKTLFVGGGTNMLFAFEEFDGIIIKNSLKGWNYDEKTKILEVYSNEFISNIAESLEKDFGQDLWHRFIGLPGSVGGAIFGNAGCFGLETENNLIEVFALNLKTGQIEILGKEDCDFSYRSSIFKKTENYFIIKAKFDLSKKIEKYHSDVDNIYFREHKQPKGNTCGSFFKNPKIDLEKFLSKYGHLCEENVKNISAGFLLEKSGLKGFRLGTAFFSDLHSNFLMSDGNGNYKDLLDLIKLAQQKVKQNFDIDLEIEVRIIYN